MEEIKISEIYKYKNDLCEYFSIYHDNKDHDKKYFDIIMEKIDTIVIFDKYESKELYEKEFINDNYNVTPSIKKELNDHIEGYPFRVNEKTIFGSELILFFKFTEYKILNNFINKFKPNISKLYTKLENINCCCK